MKKIIFVLMGLLVFSLPAYADDGDGGGGGGGGGNLQGYISVSTNVYGDIQFVIFKDSLPPNLTFPSSYSMTGDSQSISIDVRINPKNYRGSNASYVASLPTQAVCTTTIANLQAEYPTASITTINTIYNDSLAVINSWLNNYVPGKQLWGYVRNGVCRGLRIL